MNEVDVLEVGREALFVTLQAAGPLMAVAMIVGLAIAVLQALTTIQEMTLTFVPKIVAMFIALVFLLPFMMAVVVDFGRSMFDRIASFG